MTIILLENYTTIIMIACIYYIIIYETDVYSNLVPLWNTVPKTLQYCTTFIVHHSLWVCPKYFTGPALDQYLASVRTQIHYISL